MRTFIIVLSFLLFCVNGFSQKKPLFSKTELVIKFKSSISKDLMNDITKQKFNIKTLDILNEKYNLRIIELTGNKKEKETFVLKFNTVQDIPTLIRTYLNTGFFEYVEPNYQGKGDGFQCTPNDFYYNRQWSHYNDGTFSLSPSTIDADIDTDLAWDITKGDSNIIVAILDSGSKLDHPEFSGRIWINTKETQNGMDSDGNGYVDDTFAGWDFANNDNDPTDDYGHGTNVTGIALASGNNNIGYAGVNWHSKIMICKILDNNGHGYYTWWSEAIYYAVDNGADVINMSVGGHGSSLLLKDAIDYADSNNVPVVVSVGNNNDSLILYPAKYAKAFAIGSTNPDDTRSAPFPWDSTSGSNFGSELDFVAPGNYIYGLFYNSNTNYNYYWAGTSQAAPLVTGVISLLLSIAPTLTVSQIRTILEESSEDQVGDSSDVKGWDQYYGYGRINAFNAVTNPILSVSQFSNVKDNINVYPNPISSNETLTITNINNGNYLVIVYNILGEKLYSFNSTVSNLEIKIPMRFLNTSGTYLLKIINELNRKSINKKIIIE